MLASIEIPLSVRRRAAFWALSMYRQVVSTAGLLEMSKSRAVECSLWLMAAVGLEIA